MILIESIGRLHLQAGVTAIRSFWYKSNPYGTASIPLVKFQSRSFEEMPIHPTPASSRFSGHDEAFWRWGNIGFRDIDPRCLDIVEGSPRSRGKSGDRWSEYSIYMTIILRQKDNLISLYPPMFFSSPRGMYCSLHSALPSTYWRRDVSQGVMYDVWMF